MVFFMSQKIVVIGCGWLGFPLAKALVKNGHAVIGTTTSDQKHEQMSGHGVQPIVLKVNADTVQTSDDAIWQSEIFIIAIPPKVSAQGRDFHIDQVRALLERIPERARIVYVSSTSVYPSLAGKYDESFELSAEKTGNPTLYACEKLISDRVKSTIVRCGGLMGEQRISGRYFAGKEVSGENQPVNYIHQSDAVGLISEIIENNIFGTYNLVSPLHPTRSEVYRANSRKFGFTMPTFKDEGSQRIIDGTLIADKLDYTFEHPDPSDFHS